MDDQPEIKPDAPVIDAAGDTDIPANAGEPDPNVTPAGAAATSFADAAASFGGLSVDSPVEAVEEEADTQEAWKRGELREGGLNVSTAIGTIFYIATPHHKDLSEDDVRWFCLDLVYPTDGSIFKVIKHRLDGTVLFHVSDQYELLDLPTAVEDEAEVAKEEIVASLEDDTMPAADDEDMPEPETLQTAETTGHDFNALMFRTAALNAAASICQGTGASAYEVTAKAEDLMVWLQGDASSADFEEPRD